jgi:hypothetical protein
MSDGLPPLPESAWHQPRMRRRRTIVGSGCAVLLLVMGACAGCFVTGSRAQPEGAAFIREIAPRLMRPWTPEVLSQNAAPALTSAMKPGQLEKLARFVSTRLGPLARIDAIREGSFKVYVGSAGFQVRTQYVMEATFEKGPATIQWALLKQGDTWSIEGFHVNSDLLLE